MGKTLGQVAYEAYGESVGFLNHEGKPMPPWGELPWPIQNAWDNAVGVVAVEIGKRIGKMRTP